MKTECIDGYENKCIMCDRLYHKKYRKMKKKLIKDKKSLYYKNNKEVIISKSKEYYYENYDDVREVISQYKKNNKDKVNKYAKMYMKKNKHISSWRRLLKSSLKRLGKVKEGNTIDLLQYSATELKEHLESLFTDGMSWDNHGEWHIDHIKPISKFDKDTPPSIVNALSNLQPLWAIDNLRKGNN